MGTDLFSKEWGQIYFSPLLDHDPCYQAMSAPEELYRQFVEQAIPEEEQRLIHDRVQCNGLTDGSAFTDEIELRAGLCIEHRLPGRPRKQKNKSVPINHIR